MDLNLDLQKIDPKLLQPNPWNSNRVSDENGAKLENSIERVGNFKPTLVRELEDGTLQIVGGYHRNQAAIRRGDTEVPILNLGIISDTKAKEIGLADNERYGEDDPQALRDLLENLETSDELSSFLPYEDDEFDSLFAYDSIDLDDLDVDDDDDSPIERPQSVAPTHRVLRFKVPVGDAERLSEYIERIGKSNGFTGSDELTNAGDALVHIMKEVWQ